MTKILEMLNIPRQELLVKVKRPEDTFHDILSNGILKEFLERFPNSDAVYNRIMVDIFNPKPLTDGWGEQVIKEINSLIEFHGVNLKPILDCKFGEPNFHSDEEGILSGAMDKFFKEQRLDDLTLHDVCFLRDFFYGIDSTDWSQYAVMSLYTKCSFQFDQIIRANRGGFLFGIEGQMLVIKGL